MTFPEIAVTGVLLAFLFVVASAFASPTHRARRTPTATPALRESSAVVSRVVDGDTLHVGKAKVRLWGVDAPETGLGGRKKQKGGDAAKAFASSVVGQKVVLERSPRADKYGRTLAYVRLRNGTVLNEELLRRGLVRHTPQYRHPRLKEYAALEEQARKRKVGIWK